MEAALGLVMVTALVLGIFVLIPVLLAPVVLLIAWARRPKGERAMTASLLPEIEGVEEIAPVEPDEAPEVIETPEVHREDVVRAA